MTIEINGLSGAKRIDLQEELEEKLKNRISESATEFKAEFTPSEIYYSLKECSFIEVTPPEEEPPMNHIMTMDSLNNYRRGSTTKPGNIKLNWKKLMLTIPSATQLVASIAYDNSILKVCAALQLWNSIWNAFTIKISKEEAIVIVALWKNCNSEHKISLDEGFIVSKKLFEAYGEPELSFKKYNKIIDSLIRIESIELTEGVIRLCEWIRKQYIDKNAIC